MRLRTRERAHRRASACKDQQSHWETKYTRRDAGHEGYYKHNAHRSTLLPASEIGIVADVVVVRRLTVAREVVDDTGPGSNPPGVNCIPQLADPVHNSQLTKKIISINALPFEKVLRIRQAHLPTTPSDHAFRPRLPTTPSGHAFRPRLPTWPFGSRTLCYSAELAVPLTCRRCAALSPPIALALAADGKDNECDDTQVLSRDNLD